MAISFVGVTAAVEATSIALPTHQAGDLIVLAIANESANSITPASGWSIGAYRGTSSKSLIIAVKTAMSDAEVSDTWSDATLMSAAVYRGSENYLAASTGLVNQGIATSVIYGGVNSYTYIAGAGSRALVPLFWVVAASMVENVTTAPLETPPAGYTFRSGLVGTNAEIAFFDTAGDVSSIANRSVAMGASVSYVSGTMIIYETTTAKDFGGGNIIIIED